jgi:hypothetical protein
MIAGVPVTMAIPPCLRFEAMPPTHDSHDAEDMSRSMERILTSTALRHAGREGSRAGEAVLMARSSRTDTRGLRPSRCGVRSSGALIRCNIALYRFPGPERIAVGVSPEHRLQLLPRWLDKF